MLGLQNYLLPQLLGVMVRIIGLYSWFRSFPSSSLASLCGLLVLSLILYLWVKHQPALSFIGEWQKSLFIGQTVRLYTTAYYARDGKSLRTGRWPVRLGFLLCRAKVKLFRELGADLEEALMLDRVFLTVLLLTLFSPKELSLIIAMERLMLGWAMS